MKTRPELGPETALTRHAGDPEPPLAVASPTRARIHRTECSGGLPMLHRASLTRAPIDLTPGRPSSANSGEPCTARRRGTSVPASPAAAVDRIGPGPPDLEWTREIRSPLDLI